MRIQQHYMQETFSAVLKSRDCDGSIAERTARILTSNSLDGVYSHGVNRFSRLIDFIQKGHIHPNAKPEKLSGSGAFERWDGMLGMGVTNAEDSMAQAMKISEANGIGLVALRNTNHWMRGGFYGRQAADGGKVGICWTNTIANMPPWGGVTPAIGNNPLILAVPRSNGDHIVVDTALSQFSFGKLDEYRVSGDPLPVPGGYDKEGLLSDNAEAIVESQRPLPIGFWKGSGISLALDMIAAILSGGSSCADITARSSEEYGVSQIFIAVDPSRMGGAAGTDQLVDKIIDQMKSSDPAEGVESIRYPGERVLSTRKENSLCGIPVDDAVWQEIMTLIP